MSYKPPTDINVSSTAFDENIKAGSVVATLSSTDPDSGDSFTYALVTGAGDTDNAAFSIDGNQLKIKASPDFESKSSYSIRLQTKDSGGRLPWENPTVVAFDFDIHTSFGDIGVPIPVEFSAAGSTSTYIYGSQTARVQAADLSDIETLVSSLQLTDKTKNISEDEFAAVKTDDGDIWIIDIIDSEYRGHGDAIDGVKVGYGKIFSAGLTLEKQITLNVSDLNEAPTGINVSSTAFDENIKAGSVVATLSSTDEDAGDTHTYLLVANSTASNDNFWFEIVGDQLKIKESPDFETKNSYGVGLQTTDSGGLSFVTGIGFSVNNIRESVDIYRFFNVNSGVHFYTPSAEERDNVISRPDWGYQYEGVAYQAPSTGTQLYRFYNQRKRYHFITASHQEAITISNNPDWGYQYEGRSFTISPIKTVSTPTEVFRFYNPAKGVHFYSASADEANNVITNSLGPGYNIENALKQDNLLANGWGYVYEGIAWYAT